MLRHRGHRAHREMQNKNSLLCVLCVLCGGNEFMKRFFVLLAVVFAQGVFAADPPAAPKVTYQDNILPLFRNSCLNCHNPDKKKGGLDISSSSAAMAGSDSQKVIVPGDPDGSVLFRCV